MKTRCHRPDFGEFGVSDTVRLLGEIAQRRLRGLRAAFRGDYVRPATPANTPPSARRLSRAELVELFERDLVRGTCASAPAEDGARDAAQDGAESADSAPGDRSPYVLRRTAGGTASARRLSPESA